MSDSVSELWMEAQVIGSQTPQSDKVHIVCSQLRGEIPVLTCGYSHALSSICKGILPGFSTNTQVHRHLSPSHNMAQYLHRTYANPFVYLKHLWITQDTHDVTVLNLYCLGNNGGEKSIHTGWRNGSLTLIPISGRLNSETQNLGVWIVDLSLSFLCVLVSFPVACEVRK